jgi:hypothetical protein
VILPPALDELVPMETPVYIELLVATGLEVELDVKYEV